MNRITMALAIVLASAAPAAAQTTIQSSTGSDIPSGSLMVVIPPGGSGGVQPVGSPPLPPGTSKWVLTYDDEFNTDSSLNTSQWNGSAGYPSGYTNPYCTSGSGGDQLGNAGGSSGSCGEYYGTSGTAPYESLASGVGAYIQSYYGGSSYFDNDWAALTNVDLSGGNQTYGYWEISAEQPHDNSGEGDGYHPDIWLTVPSRSNFSGASGVPCQDEADIAEGNLGANSTARDNTHFGVWDNNVSQASVAYPGSAGDLSSAFHVYGLQWAPSGANSDTGSSGSFQVFFDGSSESSPVGVNDSCWLTNGAYLLLWEQVATTAFFPGGSNEDSSTSNNDPLIVKYVRVWQAE